MERRSRSSSKRNGSSNLKHQSLNVDNMIQGFHQTGQKQNSRTLSPDRRSKPSLGGGSSSTRDLTFPKTSPHHNKSGSYNQYNHPALTLPTSSSIALGVNGTASKSSLPAPPPRAPVTSLTNGGGEVHSSSSSYSSSSMSQKDSLRFSSSPQQQVM